MTIDTKIFEYGTRRFAVLQDGRVFTLFKTLSRLQTGSPCGEYVSVLVGGRDGKRMTVHRLVASLYLPNPDNKRTVNHKDGNKRNNCVSNLEWATYSENHLHSFAVLGRIPGKQGKGRGGYIQHNKPADTYGVYLLRSHVRKYIRTFNTRHEAEQLLDQIAPI